MKKRMIVILLAGLLTMQCTLPALAEEALITETGAFETEADAAVIESMSEPVTEKRTFTESEALTETEIITETETMTEEVPSEAEAVPDSEAAAEVGENCEPELIISPDTEPEVDLDELESEWAEAAGIAENDENQIAAASVNAQSVDLYALYTPAYEEVLTIPSEYPQEFQLKVTDSGTVSYTVVDGESVTVTGDGMIRPATKTMYQNGNILTSWPTGAEGEKVIVEHVFGTSVVQVRAGTAVYNVTATVYDYAKIYADEIIDRYIAENIKTGMSNYEILDAITRFPAQYDYDVSCSSCTSMIVFGGGDCVASTGAILTICKKLGIQARSRDASGDYGAGSGHMNAVITMGGETYMADAGYVQTAPRTYSLEKINEFRYSLNADKASVTITEYLGVGGDVEIPAYLDGYAVTAIGDEAFYWIDELKSVKIPNEVTSIGLNAFAYCANLKQVSLPSALTVIGEAAFFCTGLESVEIPSGVTEICDGAFDRSSLKSLTFSGNQLKTIGIMAFHWCNLTSVEIPSGVISIGEKAFNTNNSLEKINVSPQNAYYSSVDGVLFNKDQTVLIQYPANRPQSKYDIPKSVTTIGNSAFAEVFKLTSVTIPKSVKSVEQYAFGESESLEKIWFEGEAPEFGENVFAETLSYDPYFGDFVATHHTVYYPKKNTTWTESFRKGIEGNLTWEDYCGTLQDPDHKFKEVITLEATCTTNGKAHQECTVCGEKKKDSDRVIIAKGHQFGPYKVTAEATVFKEGTQTSTCTECGAVQTQTLPKLKATVHYSTDSLKLQIGKSVSLKSYVTGMQKGDSISKWESFAPNIASVETDGKVTAKDIGAAIISVTTQGGASATITLHVYCGSEKNPDHTYVEVIEQAATCTKDGKAYQKCSGCGKKKDGSDRVIAAKGHQFGPYKVTAEATVFKAGTKTSACTVCGATQTQTVPQLKATVSYSTNSLNLQVGKSVSFKSYVTGMQAGDSISRWKSFAPNIASVDTNGTVKALKAGRAYIAVGTKAGAVAKMLITVQDTTVHTTDISGLHTGIALEAGKTVTLRPVVKPSNSRDPIVYKSVAPNIATVTANGVIKGIRAGYAYVYVKSGTVYKKILIKVTAPTLKAITGVRKTGSLYVGATYQLRPQRYPAGSAGVFYYKSSNSAVAAVDKNGKITAKKKGTAVITVMARNVSTTLKLTVK